MVDPGHPREPVDDVAHEEDLAQGEAAMARHERPVGTAAIAEAGTARGANVAEAVDNPLFPPADARDLQNRWEMIQASFVDEPRHAVEEADALVAGAMTRIAETFAQERSRLEEQWDRGGDVSTEDLRIALKRYRAFFGRLLAI